MKRLLTAGIFGTILGIVGAGTVNASIVSSGFLDEKLTEYALSTSLDLKANQSDFTELNTQISNSVDNLKSLWSPPVGDLAYDFNPNKVNNNINGAFDLVEGFIRFSMLSLTNGWTDKNDGTTYLGVIDLNTKIGTLPSAILPSAWTSIPYYSENDVNMPDAGFPLPTTIGEQLEFLFNGEQDSPIDRMFRVITMTGGSVALSDEPSKSFLGLHPLTQKVKNIEENITLPSGEILPSKGLAFLLPEPSNSTYPTSIRDFMTDIYTGYWGIANVADAVYFGNEYAAQKDPALVVKGLRQITDEIGTLPSGGFTVRPELTELLIWAEQENTYPTSLSELITALYGNPETGKPGLLFGIVGGFRTSFGEDIGFGAAKALANKAQATADANTAKIGDLPTEYATVGAALTAIKGIAEDAKAAALAAIPDPKQEGSSGKFVLTVDIVGDNATYHWEKIDREGETTTE